MTETAVYSHETLNALSEGSTPVPPYGRVMFVSCRSGVLMAERVLNTYVKNLPDVEKSNIPHLDGIDF